VIKIGKSGAVSILASGEETLRVHRCNLGKAWSAHMDRWFPLSRARCRWKLSRCPTKEEVNNRFA